MSKTLPMKLAVLHKEFISTNMLRISLGGDELKNFPVDQESSYIKLHFAKPDIHDGNIEKQLLSDNSLHRPLLRTYTISKQRYLPNQIDVDFVIHETGPACNWAVKCSLGDNIYIVGPGKKKLVDFEADWFFIVGDMTALPAICVNLERLPKHAKGYAVIEILNENDKQILTVPKNFQIHWVIKAPHLTHSPSTDLLFKKVKELKPFSGVPSIWLACEHSSLIALKQYFTLDLEIDKRNIYASSYWKKDVDQDELRVLKSKVTH